MHSLLSDLLTAQLLTMFLLGMPEVPGRFIFKFSDFFSAYSYSTTEMSTIQNTTPATEEVGTTVEEDTTTDSVPVTTTTTTTCLSG